MLMVGTMVDIHISELVNVGFISERQRTKCKRSNVKNSFFIKYLFIY